MSFEVELLSRDPRELSPMSANLNSESDESTPLLKTEIVSGFTSKCPLFIISVKLPNRHLTYSEIEWIAFNPLIREKRPSQNLIISPP